MILLTIFLLIPYKIYTHVQLQCILVVSAPPPSLPTILLCHQHRSSCLSVLLLAFSVFIAHWVQFVLTVCARVWGHSLGHGQPTSGHTCKGKHTPVPLLSHQPTAGSLQLRSLCPLPARLGFLTGLILHRKSQLLWVPMCHRYVTANTQRFTDVCWASLPILWGMHCFFLLLLWFPKACREGSRCPFYSRVLRVTIANKLEQWVSVRRGFRSIWNDYNEDF